MLMMSGLDFSAISLALTLNYSVILSYYIEINWFITGPTVGKTGPPNSGKMIVYVWKWGFFFDRSNISSLRVLIL